MKQIKFWDIFENTLMFYDTIRGFEMFVIKQPGKSEEWHTPNTLNKKLAAERGYDYTAEEIKQYNIDARAAKKEFRFYVKGLRILFKNNFIPGAIEQMAHAYMNKKPVELIERFKKLVYGHYNVKSIVKIGQGSKYSVLDYVDGSFAIEIKE